METQEILEQLEALLEEERMAIRTLKGDRVYSIACEKLELMKRLEAVRAPGSDAYAARVKEVVRRLRHNGVLLVQAKAVLAEAIRAKTGSLATTPRIVGRADVKLNDRRFSVVG